jgi:hypothetical protein
LGAKSHQMFEMARFRCDASPEISAYVKGDTMLYFEESPGVKQEVALN